MSATDKQRLSTLTIRCSRPFWSAAPVALRASGRGGRGADAWSDSDIRVFFVSAPEARLGSVTEWRKK